MPRMQVGRSAQPRGDGTLELTQALAPASSAGSATSAGRAPVPLDAAPATFSVQSWLELPAVAWERSSALTKLLTVASVCNKAKFSGGDEPAGARRCIRCRGCRCTHTTC